MSAFDKIIGYDHIKAELMQISDMIHHPEVYAALDAKLPQGLLLSGEPGLGKTLMATALMEDSGLPCFTVRRSQSEDEFLKQLAHTFDEARRLRRPCSCWTTWTNSPVTSSVPPRSQRRRAASTRCRRSRCS